MNKLLLICALSLTSAVATAKVNNISTQRVLPEVSTTVTLSNRDVNRIVCESGEAVKPVFSKEKPMKVEIGADRKTFFVKFLFLQSAGGNQYYSEPTELYLTCGNATFELIINPQHEAARKVLLGSGTANTIKENQKLFSALSLEETATQLSISVMKDANDSGLGLPPTFEQQAINGSWEKASADRRGVAVPIELKKDREVNVEGTGLKATQFTIRALRNVQLSEMMFLNTRYGKNIFAITLESLSLNSGQMTSLVIIEREGL
ncbi:TPA: type-F conjugative transfer system secretin TraK [Yersinia enterocolitica]